MPIVVSCQGSNPSPPSQPTSLNIQVNVEASSSGATKKVSTALILKFECFTICITSKWFDYSFQRGRLVKKNMTTALNNNGKGVQLYHVHQKIKL